VGMRFDVGEYPATRAALAGGAFRVRADDPGADPGELAILDDLAAVAVVGAGGIDLTGQQWLVEVYTDALSGPERDLATLLRVLVVVALHPRPGPEAGQPASHPPVDNVRPLRRRGGAPSTPR